MSELKPCEAIEILESIYPSQKQIATGEYPDVAEALDLAIDALRAQPSSEPLTLEQLREMHGQPVWIEYINLQGARRDRKWCICHTIYGDIQPMDGYAEGGTDTSAICYGKTWLAYRRKPERSENDA